MTHPLSSKRRILMDFHMGNAINELKFDMQRFISDCKETGVEYIYVMTKDAHGCHYYNTKAALKHPKMEGDFLADTIAACGQNGIGVMAYYNLLCNPPIAAENPDYRQVYADKTPVLAYPPSNYDIVCMNSPYRELAIGELKQIAEEYPVKGFFIDISYVWDGACHCEYCKKAYREKYGIDMPDAPLPGSAEARREYEFKLYTKTCFVRDAVKAVKSIRNDIVITWNGSGRICRAELTADAFADFTSTEMHPPYCLHPTVTCRWNRCRKKPYELTLPHELNSWGDWTVAPAASLKSIVSVAAALGAACTCDVTTVPSGKNAGGYSPAMLDVIKTCFDHIKEREQFIGGTKLPSAAILFDTENSLRTQYTENDECLKERGSNVLYGAGRILMECGIDYDIIDSSILPEDLSYYEFVMLPDQGYISPQMAEAVRNYVKNGGRLIASGITSLYNSDMMRRENFGLADLFGVDFESTSPYSICYIDDFKKISDGIRDETILISDAYHPAIRTAAREGSEILAIQTDPALEHKPYRHVHHGHAHPAAATDFPAVVMNKYGQGLCVYISVSAESSFFEKASPWIRYMYRNCIRLINPYPRLIVEGDPSADVSLHEKDGKLIIHLALIARSMVASPYTGAGEHIETEPLARDIRVKIRCKAKKIYTAPNKKELPFEKEGDYISFSVPLIVTSEIIVIEE